MKKSKYNCIKVSKQSIRLIFIQFPFQIESIIQTNTFYNNKINLNNPQNVNF